MKLHFKIIGTLEMVECDKKRVEQDVVICLQLEDGTRLNGSYEPSKNLLEVITEMCPEKSSSEQSPVVIYMRNEIHGEKLASTDLKSLGLTSGGRALLRLINSDPESLKVQANVSAPLLQKPKIEPNKDEKEKPKSQLSTSAAFHVSNVEELKSQLTKKDEKAEEEEKMDVDEKAGSSEIEEPTPVAQQAVPTEREVIEQAAEPEPVINILDDRGTIIFSLDSINTSSLDLPDSFFELTESDVRMLYKELREQVENLENAPLQTAEYRKLEENKKILNQLATYKSCAIRIQLPNRHVIQSKFSTVETVGFVMEFLRKFLINPDIKFYLCEYWQWHQSCPY